MEEKQIYEIEQEENLTKKTLEQLHEEGLLPCFSIYKEVWVHFVANRGVFFCRKNSVWWMVEAIYNLSGEVVSETSERLGKTEPWHTMRTISGTSKEQFKNAFNRIK